MIKWWTSHRTQQHTDEEAVVIIPVLNGSDENYRLQVTWQRVTVWHCMIWTAMPRQSHNQWAYLLTTCLRGLRPGKTQTQLQRPDSLEILDLASMCIILFRQRTTKALIRLRGYADWSVHLLFAFGITRFSHDAAQLLYYMKDTTFSSTLQSNRTTPYRPLGNGYCET